MFPIDLLPPDIGVARAAMLMAVSFVSGTISAVVGIGGGLLMLAVLASAVPAAALIPVHGILQIGSNLGRVFAYLRHVAWPAVPGFTLGSAVGAVAGGSVAVTIPPGLVQAGVGAFILWSVLFRPPGILRRAGWLTGTLSSFLTMFFGASAPFVMVYVQGLALAPMATVGTHAALMMVQHVLKTAVFGVLGFAYGPWLALVAALIAAGFLGTLAGRAILRRTADARFALAVKAVLVLLAARLIWMGMERLAAG